MADRSTYPGTPRWVKVSGIVAAVLALLIVVVMITGVGGPHGPARHMPSGDVGTPPAGVTEDTPGDRASPGEGP